MLEYTDNSPLPGFYELGHICRLANEILQRLNFDKIYTGSKVQLLRADEYDLRKTPEYCRSYSKFFSADVKL